MDTYPPNPDMHWRITNPLNLDRFIPNRSAMDFDYARYMLTGGKVVDDSETCSPSKKAYMKLLAKALGMNRTRILAFKNKSPAKSTQCFEETYTLGYQTTPVKPSSRRIPKVPELILDAPDMIDDFYLNLLDWGCGNVLAMALENSVWLWDAANRSISELLVVDDDYGPVTSVRWAPDGKHLAVGLDSSHVLLYDASTGQEVSVFSGGHSARVGSLDWNDHILTTGGKDTVIVNNDVRIRSHIVGTYAGHTDEICGLKWCPSGLQLASGANDDLVHIWSMSMASSSSPNRWLHRLSDHQAGVKALCWSPSQSNLLATGGGVDDHCIKFWNTRTGACLNSVNTGSQLCSLLWSGNGRELLSSHGYSDNQLVLWKYPSMVKITELRGHTERPLYMTQSPDGCTVATASADEKLCLWNVFEATRKPTNTEPFPHIARIR